MTSSEVPNGLPGAVRSLLAAAMARDADRCAETTAEIHDRYGVRGLYATCCGLAGAFAKATGMEADSENMISLDNLDGAPEDDAELWAARFLVACGNRDDGTAMALFHARLANEAFFADGLTALLVMVGSAVKAAS